MKKNSLTDNFSELREVVKKYIEVRISLVKALLLEKLTKIGTYFFTVVLSIVILASIMLLLTLAFSFWYSNTYGNIYEGFLISAGFYALMGITLYLLRRPVFANNIIKNVGSILFTDEEEDNNRDIK